MWGEEGERGGGMGGKKIEGVYIEYYIGTRGRALDLLSSAPAISVLFTMLHIL